MPKCLATVQLEIQVPESVPIHQWIKEHLQVLLESKHGYIHVVDVLINHISLDEGD
jgi:hypothetical protein